MIESLINEAEKNLEKQFKEIDNICFYNSKKILDAFHKYNVSESDFYATTGYGYADVGRDKIEKIYAEIFKSDSALVRNQFISGTHALTIALFALLRPNDTLLSITGKPYDTLDSVIGFNNNPSSLKSFNIKYEQIDLVNNEFDEEKIIRRVKEGNIKVIEIQRSRGYSLRETISIDKCENIIKKIKEIDKNIIVLVDNCYCELVSLKEPTEVGSDVCVGSLIKNLGGGITTNGAYIVGKEEYINLCSERLNVPGEGKEVGPSQGANKDILLGLYLSANVVKNSLKTVLLASYVFEKIGFTCNPRWNEIRSDIVQLIYLNNKENLIEFVKSIQSSSAIDHHVSPMPSNMPGYDDEIIMASGSFTQGSSIELSADAPLKEPFVVYMQGSLTYEYGKLAIYDLLNKFYK